MSTAARRRSVRRPGAGSVKSVRGCGHGRPALADRAPDGTQKNFHLGALDRALARFQGVGVPRAAAASRVARACAVSSCSVRAAALRCKDLGEQGERPAQHHADDEPQQRKRSEREGRLQASRQQRERCGLNDARSGANQPGFSVRCAPDRVGSPSAIRRHRGACGSARPRGTSRRSDGRRGDQSRRQGRENLRDE